MSDGRRAGFQTQSASHTRPITVLPQYQQHQSHQSNYHTPTQEYERTQWSTIVQMYKTKYRSQAHEDCTDSLIPTRCLYVFNVDVRVLDNHRLFIAGR